MFTYTRRKARLFSVTGSQILAEFRCLFKFNYAYIRLWLFKQKYTKRVRYCCVCSNYIMSKRLISFVTTSLSVNSVLLRNKFSNRSIPFNEYRIGKIHCYNSVTSIKHFSNPLQTHNTPLTLNLKNMSTRLKYLGHKPW